MNRATSARRCRGSSGSTLVEFTLCAFLIMIVLLSVVEMGRMVLVYTAVSNAARAAARYAIVHHSLLCGVSDSPEVKQVATNFAKAGLIDETRLTINVTCQDSVPAVGEWVQVGVSYSYDPLIGMLPLSVPLSNESRGVIVF